jgi:glyoxylase-like metal-dependent hydrolase (beta-lactamase superfamily II)
MPINNGVFFVPEISIDPRVKVFRREINDLDEFEGLEVDAYIIITERYLVVFDTLLCPEDSAIMMNMVENLCFGRQILVVNSHADWDHSWGNAFFSGEHAAPIIAHHLCLTRMQSEVARKELVDYRQRYPIFQHVELIPPTITFGEGITIYGGDLTIELIPAPGHHPDHIAAWIPQLSLLLAFDAVEKPLPCIENADAVPAMFATLERFVAMQPERVLCSHGKSTSFALVKENLEYFREIERRSRATLQERRPSDDELEHASEIIHYSLDEVTGGSAEPFDRTYYNWAHDANVRSLLQWLMSYQGEI